MLLLHLLQRDGQPELTDSNHFVSEIVAIPVFVLIVEFGITQPVFFQWSITGIPRPGEPCFADMGDAGVRSSPIKPDSFHTGSEAIFSKLVVLSSVGDLSHVGVLHR